MARVGRRDLHARTPRTMPCPDAGRPRLSRAPSAPRCVLRAAATLMRRLAKVAPRPGRRPAAGAAICAESFGMAPTLRRPTLGHSRRLLHDTEKPAAGQRLPGLCRYRGGFLFRCIGLYTSARAQGQMKTRARPIIPGIGRAVLIGGKPAWVPQRNGFAAHNQTGYSAVRHGNPGKVGSRRGEFR